MSHEISSKAARKAHNVEEFIDFQHKRGEKSECFSDMLFRLLDESGMTEPELYKKANVAKAVFSNIRSNRNYTPKKNMILALAITLKVSREDAKQLLKRAGYAFNNFDDFDNVIIYYLENHIYDIDLINAKLDELGLPLLGSKLQD